MLPQALLVQGADLLAQHQRGHLGEASNVKWVGSFALESALLVIAATITVGL